MRTKDSLFKPLLSEWFDTERFVPRTWMEEWSKVPAVNIHENENGWSFDVAAPGFSKEDFQVEVHAGILTVSAEKKSESQTEEKEKKYSRKAFSYSSFTRQFRLPENVSDDGVSASYQQGILKVEVPKKQASTSPPIKKINIQ